MSDIPLRKLRRQLRNQESGIALASPNQMPTAAQKAAVAARRARNYPSNNERYGTDSDEEAGLLDSAYDGGEDDDDGPPESMTPVCFALFLLAIQTLIDTT